MGILAVQKSANKKVPPFFPVKMIVRETIIKVVKSLKLRPDFSGFY